MTSAAISESTTQISFNPSWIRSTFHGSSSATSGGPPQLQRCQSATDGSGNPYGVGNQDDAGVDYPLAAPIFVKNRYGREDLLALLTKDVKPPDGLEMCPFFGATMQKPVTLLSFTELETRLQHNINSSKAMSSIAHAERVTAVVGSSAPIAGSTATNTAATGGSVTSAPIGNNNTVAPFAPGWMDRSISSGGGGGTTMMNKSERGYLGTGRGGGFAPFRGGRPVGINSTTNTPAAVLTADAANAGRYVPSRGRGSAVSAGGGRGGGTVGAFNPRAQGLYDPRDPRDRPRQRLRSTSDDTAPVSGGVMISGSPSSNNWIGAGGGDEQRRRAWNSAAMKGASMSATDGADRPEWVSDDDGCNPASGSFDENGQFRHRIDLQKEKSLSPTNKHDEEVDDMRSDSALKTNICSNDDIDMNTAKTIGQRISSTSNATSTNTATIVDSSFDNGRQSMQPPSLAERGRTDSEEAFADAERSAQFLVDSLSADDTGLFHSQSKQTNKHHPNSAAGLITSNMAQSGVSTTQTLHQSSDSMLHSLVKPHTNLSTSSFIPVVTASTTGGISNILQGNVKLRQQPHDISSSSIDSGEDKWLYMDPRGTARGPFNSSQMNSWFVTGYFTMDLLVRRVVDQNFSTLGELIRINGGVPFSSPKSLTSSSSVPSAAAAAFDQQCVTTTIAPGFWGGEPVSITPAATVASALPNDPYVTHQKERQQRMEENQRRLAEEQLRVQQIEESTRRERERREQIMLEKEKNLQKQLQEEQALQQALEREKVRQREMELCLLEQEMRRKLEIEEQKKSADAENRRKLADMQNEERRRLEEDAIRRKNEQQRIALEIEQADIMAMQRQQHQQQRSNANELFGSVTGRQQPIDAWQQLTYSSSDVFAPTPSSLLSNEFVVVNKKAPSAAPWSKSVVAPTLTTKTTNTRDQQQLSLADIQREEERHMMAEQRQLQEIEKQKRQVLQTSNADGSVWGSSHQRLNWGQQQQQMAPSNNSSSVWDCGATKKSIDTNTSSTYMSGLFDGPTLQSSSIMATNDRNNTKKKDGSSVATKKDKVKSQAKQQSTAVTSTDSQKRHEEMKKIFQNQSSNAGDPFISWISDRVKQLNKGVDADVFASFIEGVDSPNDVEDYMISYFGDCRNTKDFIREFLEKRSEMRSTHKKATIARDDLSSPAVAVIKDNESITQSSTGSAGGAGAISTGGSTAATAAAAAAKKKKRNGKGGKMIIDGSCLGFTATGDPNRRNVGDIDSF